MDVIVELGAGSWIVGTVGHASYRPIPTKSLLFHGLWPLSVGIPSSPASIVNNNFQRRPESGLLNFLAIFCPVAFPLELGWSIEEGRQAWLCWRLSRRESAFMANWRLCLQSIRKNYAASTIRPWLLFPPYYHAVIICWYSIILENRTAGEVGLLYCPVLYVRALALGFP